MQTRIHTLAEILESAEDYSWNRAVYVAGEYPWSASTIAAVLDADEVEDAEKQPALVKQYNLQYALDIETAQDIVETARQQNPSLNIQILVDSFNYYWKYDAFLLLT